MGDHRLRDLHRRGRGHLSASEHPGQKGGKKPLLLGTGAEGSDAATSTGIRQTALVAMIFVALSVVIYCFYNDKEITRVLREGK